MIAVSERAGLVGWHLRALLHAQGERWIDVDLRQPAVDLALPHDIDRAIHVAGITRGTDEDLHEGNIALARDFVARVERSGSRPRQVVHANSVQATKRTPYGLGKAGASLVLAEAAERWGADFLDVAIENVFGEHGTPDHNTVTSTFCHRLAHGLPLPIDSDQVRTFVHAQDVAEALTAVITTDELRMRGTTTSIPELARTLSRLVAAYDQGTFPDTGSAFERDLLNTYRSYAFDVRPVLRLPAATDARGTFTEVVRAAGGPSQSSVSTTRPGVTRGDHFHRRKTERFAVVSGRARIVVRRVLTNDRRVFDVHGDEPVAIDMPTLWSHAITNTGDTALVTAFWTDELHDPDRPDTHQDPA